MAALSRLRMAAPPLTRLLASKRAYGSAAAAVEYDYDYDYDYEAQRNQKRGMELDSEGWQSGRGVQWVIMGDPTTKRHVYAERLSKLLEVPHISMGTLVRQELHPHSSLYKQIANAVNQGKLVPEDVIFRLLSKRLEEGYQNGETGFILDGIPRTRIQAEVLDQIADIDLVVNLICMKDSKVKEHLGGDDIHPCSQEFLKMGNGGLNFSPQSPDGHVKTSGASVDGTWKEKLRIYTEQSMPLEDYYRKQRKLVDFQVAGAPGDAWQGLLAALHLQHMSAVGSSQKLTA